MLLFVLPKLYQRHRRIESLLDWILIALWTALTLTALISPEKRGAAILGLIFSTLAHSAILGFVEGWLGVTVSIRSRR